MLSQEELDVLRSTFLFCDYSGEEFAALSRRLRFVCADFRKGEQIFSPESFRKELGVLLSGRVQVTKGSGDLVVSNLTVGDLFGAAAIFNEEAEYVSTLTAKTPCRVLFFPQKEFQALLDQEARVRWNYIRYLSGRIRFLSGKVDSLIQGTGEKKLSSYLLHHIGERGVVRLDCSMTELAARLKIGRASLYRELNKLEEQGLISRRGKEITIVDSGQLARQSGGIR